MFWVRWEWEECWVILMPPGFASSPGARAGSRTGHGARAGAGRGAHVGLLLRVTGAGGLVELLCSRAWGLGGGVRAAALGLKPVGGGRVGWRAAT